MSQPLFPLAVWLSGTNENSIPANDNALRVEVLMGPAEGVANAPPAAPADGDQYVIGSSWGGFTAGNVVIYKGGTWLEWEAFKGWVKLVGGVQSYYNGTEWVAGSSGEGIPDAPLDGKTYGRKNAAWAEVSSGSGSARDAVTALDIANGVVNIDLSLGDYFTLTLSANVTSVTFSNLPGPGHGASISILISQTGTSNRTFALPASFRPVNGSDTAIQSAAQSTTMLHATTHNNGVRWYYTMKGVAP